MLMTLWNRSVWSELAQKSACNASSTLSQSKVVFSNVSQAVEDAGSGEGGMTVCETFQQLSQSSTDDGSVTTQTAVSIQKKTMGSLLSGATLKNCTVNINMYR